MKIMTNRPNYVIGILIRKICGFNTYSVHSLPILVVDAVLGVVVVVVVVIVSAAVQKVKCKLVY